jgi:hypothetical protein
MFAVLVMKSVAVAGEFEDRAAWLAGEGQSVVRMRGAWQDVRDRLVADPPLKYWKGTPGSVELQLAQYAAECVPSSRRLLVLWFAPEIYYHADRLMAARHLVYEASYQSLAHEQQLTLDKIQRYEPPMVFESGDLDTGVRAQFPALADYVHREYTAAGVAEDNGRRFRIFLRKNEPALRSYGDHAWPCLS